MGTYNGNRVINGTYGELWLNSKLLSETKGLEAKIEISKEDVVQCGTLITGKKVSGVSCSGTIKLLKVTSYMSHTVADQIATGKFPAMTIISELKDPDSYGTEKITLTGVTFDEATLADWEAGTIGEQSYAFTFTGWNYVSKINDKYASI